MFARTGRPVPYPDVPVCSLLELPHSKQTVHRRKIRLIEGNAKCRHLRPVKGLCAICVYLSEAQNLIPPLTNCVRAYSILICTVEP
jgi:hypothetical protein